MSPPPCHAAAHHRPHAAAAANAHHRPHAAAATRADIDENNEDSNQDRFEYFGDSLIDHQTGVMRVFYPSALRKARSDVGGHYCGSVPIWVPFGVSI